MTFQVRPDLLADMENKIIGMEVYINKDLCPMCNIVQLPMDKAFMCESHYQEADKIVEMALRAWWKK